MKKKDKLIGLTPDTKLKLSKQAVNQGKSLKQFCEEMLEREAKLGSGKVQQPEERLITNLSGEDLDITGKFTRIEKNIYTNGKCFQTKVLAGENKGEKYFSTLGMAQAYLRSKS